MSNPAPWPVSSIVLIVLGVLILIPSGLCTGAAVIDAMTATGIDAQYATGLLPLFLIVGGFFMLIGGFLVWAAFFGRRPSKPP